MSTTILKALQAAARAPVQETQIGDLVRNLAEAGMKIVPEDLWAELGSALSNILEEEGLEAVATKCGFVYQNNHCRSEEHTSWQPRMATEYEWVVPVDELVCLAEDDEYACEFIEITRLFFNGDARAMRQACRKLIDAKKGG